MGVAALLLPVLVSLLGGLIFGYELGIISGALLQLKLEFLLSCSQQEVLVSALLAGALAASLVGGFLIDRCGRRTSILASNVVLLSGSVVLIFSGSFWWLVAGRVTVGFAISISSMACCIYVSEIVPPQRRGMLVSLYEAGITVGILLSYGINYFLSDWRSMLGLAVTPALLQFISLWFLPSDPSPVDTSELESQCGLMQLQDLEEVEDLGSCSSSRVYSVIDLFGTKDNMRARTVVGAGLVLFQQLTGQPNVLYYASTIFRSAGFQSNSSAVLASVGLGAVKVLSTLVAMSCADKAGRRVLLLTGCVLMTVSVTGIGCASFMIQLDPHKSCESAVAEENVSSPWTTTKQLDAIDDLTASLQLSDPKMEEQVLPSGLMSTSKVTNASKERVKHTDPGVSASGVTNSSRVTNASRERVKHTDPGVSASEVTNSSRVTNASKVRVKHTDPGVSASGVTNSSRVTNASKERVKHTDPGVSASGVTSASRERVKHTDPGVSASGVTNSSRVTSASRERVKHTDPGVSASGVTNASKERVKHTDPASGAGPLHGHAALHWITLLSLMAFVSAFSVGFGPMTWLVLSEIYPTEIRGRAFAFCNSLNWATNLLISLTFLDVIESIGLAWTFLLYGIMGVAAIIFIYIFIPETKGRTLQEVDELFLGKRFLSGGPIWWMRGRSQSPGRCYRRVEQRSASDSQRLLPTSGAQD